MMVRIWLFLAGLSGAAALVAAAYGAHGLNGVATFSPSVKIYEAANVNHALHSIMLVLTAVLLAATEGGRRGVFATWMLNIAAFCFIAGIVLFSGSLYYQIVRGMQTFQPIVPVGGSLLMAGWVALAFSAFGLRNGGLEARS